MTDDNKKEAATEKMREMSAAYAAQQDEFRKTTRETLHNATLVIDSDPDAEILILINRSQGRGMSPLWNFRLPSTLVFVLQLFTQLFFKDFVFAEKKTEVIPTMSAESVPPIESDPKQVEINDKA